MKLFLTLSLPLIQEGKCQLVTGEGILREIIKNFQMVVIFLWEKYSKTENAITSNVNDKSDLTQVLRHFM